MALKMKMVEGTPPTEKGDTYVSWDDYEVSSTSLWSDGIGSCLAVAIYIPDLKIGTLAHISGVRCPSIIPEAVYPENIVNTMASRLYQKTQNSEQNFVPFVYTKGLNFLQKFMSFGIRKYKMEAVLAGEEGKRDISEIVKRSLNALNISIVGEDLGSFGGTRGREVHFNCQAGELTVYWLPSLFFTSKI